VEKAHREYFRPEILQFAYQASAKEPGHWTKADEKPSVGPHRQSPVPSAAGGSNLSKTRVQDTYEFAQRMGYKKLGIAFCSALHEEASFLSRILEAQGFEVVSVVCKTGGTPKEYIGIKGEEDAQKPMCSPIAQAMILNDEKTDLNILVGLCVGHDSLFLKYSNAYSTVLVAKDRTLGHNPASALCPTSPHYEQMLKKGV
jgi:uncharacterized metal-binding protein